MSSALLKTGRWIQVQIIVCSGLRNSGKTRRYRLLHVAARITYGQRKLFLRLAEHCPWALALAKAFTRLRQIPLPA